MLLPPASSEQMAVKDYFKNSEHGNLILNSVAGSGKTTTALYMAAELPHKNMLVLTYNAKLKLETREKAALLTLRNLEAHSFHAFGVKYYDKRCYRDTGLVEVIANNVPASLPRYDIVIVDEAQDMTEIYYNFLRKILADHDRKHGHRPQLMIVGDENQCIYRFKNSDPRYLTMADRLYGDLTAAGEVDLNVTCSSGVIGSTANTWERLHLKTSYRVTGNMALFVNDIMLKEENLIAHKAPGAPVHYFKGNPYTAVQSIGSELIYMIEKGIIQPSDVFLLTASLKSKRAPIRVLENMLCDAGVPVYVSQGEDTMLRDDVVEGKVVISTFHSAKGLEKKLVIVFGFDANYFVYFAKDRIEDAVSCPCTLYVVATRAMDLLCVIGEDREGEHLPFLDTVRLQQLAGAGAVTIHDTEDAMPHRDFLVNDFCRDWSAPEAVKSEPVLPPSSSPQVVDLTILDRLKAEANPAQYKEEGVVDLVRWLPDPVISKCKKILQPKRLSDPMTSIFVPSTAPGVKGPPEEVADLNGLAIPTMLEIATARDKLTTRGGSSTSGQITCSMYELLTAASREVSDGGTRVMHHSVLEKYKQLKKPKDMTTVDHYLTLAAVYHAGAGVGRKGYISRLMQLSGFDWMSQDAADRCVENLKDAISDYQLAIYEHLIEETVVGRRGKGVVLQGQADILTPTTLWEVKCVQALEDIHFLQLAVYAWLWRRSQEVLCGKRRYMLINVLNKEMWEIQTDTLDEVMRHVFRHYHRKNNIASDEAFFEGLNSASYNENSGTLSEEATDEWFQSTEEKIEKQRFCKEISSTRQPPASKPLPRLLDDQLVCAIESCSSDSMGSGCSSEDKSKSYSIKLDRTLKRLHEDECDGPAAKRAPDEMGYSADAAIELLTSSDSGTEGNH